MSFGPQLWLNWLQAARRGSLGERSMGTKGLVGIGVALIFGVAVHGACMGHRDARRGGNTEFTWLPGAHGRPAAFAMILNPPAWSWVTEHHTPGMTDVLLNDQVHRR